MKNPPSGKPDNILIPYCLGGILSLALMLLYLGISSLAQNGFPPFEIKSLTGDTHFSTPVEMATSGEISKFSRLEPSP